MSTTPCVVVDPPILRAAIGVGVTVASALLDENEGFVQLPPAGAALAVVVVVVVLGAVVVVLGALVVVVA